MPATFIAYDLLSEQWLRMRLANHDGTIMHIPDGKDFIRNEIYSNRFDVEILTQADSKGMGDAVLCFNDSLSFNSTEHVLLIWGDIPFIQKNTIEQLIFEHYRQNSTFSFVTRCVNAAYTVVSRVSNGNVTNVVETREHGIQKLQPGERDIGLFLFKKNEVLDLLAQDLPGKYGGESGEHGFLYLISHLVSRGFKVLGLPIGLELDLVSLNSLNDLDGYI